MPAVLVSAAAHRGWGPGEGPLSYRGVRWGGGLMFAADGSARCRHT